MRAFLSLTLMVSLTACGGSSHRDANSSVRPSAAVATGPISRACIAAGRDNATRQLCGCVQSVANQTLSERDRARVAEFFANPEQANDTKISDTRANDAFWDRYRAFVSASRQACG